MTSPHVRPNRDPGRCGLGRVLMIDWVHRLAGLATRTKGSLRPTAGEVLVAAMAQYGTPLLDALSWMGSKAGSSCRMPDTERTADRGWHDPANSR